MKIASWKRHSNGLIVKLEDVNDRDQAQLLVNAEIAVPQSLLPQLDDGEFYWKDLLGMTVVNEAGYDFGVVDDLMETGSNDVLVVKANKTDAFGQKERLIPFLTDSVVKNVDHTQRRIIVDWDPAF